MALEGFEELVILGIVILIALTAMAAWLYSKNKKVARFFKKIFDFFHYHVAGVRS